MSKYSPYADDVEEKHRHSIRHVYSVTVYPASGDPFDLDVEDGNVTFDSSWTPYIQGDLTATLIQDQDLLDALDPRTGCRVQVNMGYIDGLTEDVHLVADLHLRSRTVDRPKNQMRLRLESDESLAADYKRMSWDTTPPLTGINEFVTYHANIACRPFTPTIVSDFGASYGASTLTGMVQDPGKDSLSMIQDAAERLDLRIFVDGDRTWRITKKSDYSGATALKLTTGASGTILESSSVLTRGDVPGNGFKNAVVIKYAWRDGSGVDQVVYGNAVVTSGPYAVANGYNVDSIERQYAIADSTKANTAASNVLKSLVGRGHQMSITAISAYWLRPQMTVTVQLPTGDQERLLVSQVRFNPTNGTMQVQLYQPINVTISTTGA